MTNADEPQSEPVNVVHEKSLLERATIQFDSPKSAKILKANLRTLSDNLGCRIRYTESTTRRIYPSSGKVIFGTLDEVAEINGSIISSAEYIQKGAVLMPFQAYRNDGNGDFTTFDGLRFQMTPGYDLADAKEGELEIMDRAGDLLGGSG